MVNVDRMATLWSYGWLLGILAGADRTAVVGGRGGVSFLEGRPRWDRKVGF